MATLSNAKKRAIAERMYINDGDNVPKIAKVLEVSESSVYRWANGKKNQLPWQEQRQGILTSPHKIKQRIDEEMLKAVNGEDYDKTLGDFLAKTLKARNSVDKEISIHLIIDVMKEYDFFLSNNYPDLLNDSIKVSSAFIAHKINEA